MIVQSVVQSARQEFMCVSKHPVRVRDSDCVHRDRREGIIVQSLAGERKPVQYSLLRKPCDVPFRILT